MKLPNLPTFHFTGWGMEGSGTFKSEVQKSNLSSNYPNLPTFHFTWRWVGVKWYFEIWSPRIQLRLQTSKSANFSFYRGEGEVGGCGQSGTFEIWSPRIQLDLKLPTLPTLHFTGWRVRGKWHFEIWSPKIQLDLKLTNLSSFNFTGWWSWGKVALQNLKSKNPTWLETSKSANFSFYRVGVGRSGTLKYEAQESNFQICQFSLKKGTGVAWDGKG